MAAALASSFAAGVAAAAPYDRRCRHERRSSNPLYHPDRTFDLLVLVPRRRRRHPRLLASASAFVSPEAPADSGRREALEKCLSLELSLGARSFSAGPATMKGGQYGSFGAVTLEKSKLDLSQKSTKSSPETAIGGGGGDIGKKIGHGGGDGGDDGGDDDDYFDDFDDGDEGDDDGLFRRRIVLQELFDKKFVDAVLQEWYKTVMNLPAGLRQAYEMGLVSSSQMVRYLTIIARPTTSRLISRSLPNSISRAFIGRMLADPSFVYKIVLESLATFGCTAWWELKNRKDRIKQEWDLALINVLTATTCNALVVWSLAPCRSYGNTFRFDLQNTIQKLPNNIFERSYPMREFDLQKRVQAFFYKAAELSLLGSVAGSIQGALSNYIVNRKEGRVAVSVPSLRTNALGYGALLGLYANTRYQMLCGLDRTMLDYFDVLGVAVFFSTALRVMNAYVGETSKCVWLGMEPDPLLQTDTLLRAYNRPSETAAQPEPRWFISKKAITSGLGFLGVKQPNGESDDASSKPRRRRVVKRKVPSAT